MKGETYMNVTGLIKVFAIEDGDRNTTASGTWGIPPRKEGDEWENDFINLMFVGKAFDKIAQVNDKDKIYITGAILRNRNYTKRDGTKSTWTEIKVFDFISEQEAKDQGLLKQGNGQNNNQGNGSGSGTRGNGSRRNGQQKDASADNGQQDQGSSQETGRSSGRRSGNRR
jgi:single-stranded DNA-binding protein